MPSVTPKIDLTGRDFDTIKTAFQNLLRSRYGSAWTDFYESGIGQALTELIAYVGDVTNFNIDLAANEFYIATLQDRASIIRLGEWCGYQLRAPTAASVTLRATIDTVQYQDVKIPAGLVIVSSDGVTFETEEGTVSSGQTEGSVVATAGQRTSDTFSSDGTTFQRFKLTHAEDIEGSLEVRVDGNLWTRQDSLVYGGASSQIYTVKHDANDFATVCFGDDIAGSIPPTGAVITVDYKIGGGISGNIGVGMIDTSVQGSLVGPGTAIDVALYNEERGSGGEDHETVEHARLWMPASIKTNGRAVTAEDFTTLATLFNDPTAGSPAYAKAKLKQIVPELNTVQVFLWSRDSQGNPAAPGSALKAAVQAYFDNNGPGAVRLICVDTEVEDGVNVYIDIDISVRVAADYATTSVLNDVTTAIQTLFQEYLSPGVDFRISQLYQYIQSVTGVEHSLATTVSATISTMENIGVGTGALQVYAGTLVHPPTPHSVSISDGTHTVIDDGDGNLTGDGTGTVDYTTGAYSVSMTATLGEDVEFTYRYIIQYYRSALEQTLPGLVSVVQGKLGHAPVVPSTLALAVGSWVITDDGNGNLVGDVVGGVNTIDYATGAYRFELPAAPAIGASLYSTYYQSLSTASEDLPIAANQLAVLGHLEVVAAAADETN